MMGSRSKSRVVLCTGNPPTREVGRAGCTLSFVSTEHCDHMCSFPAFLREKSPSLPFLPSWVAVPSLTGSPSVCHYVLATLAGGTAEVAGGRGLVNLWSCPKTGQELYDFYQGWLLTLPLKIKGILIF